MFADSITLPPGPRDETVQQFAQRALHLASKRASQHSIPPQSSSAIDPRFGSSFVEFWLKLRTAKARQANAASHNESVRPESVSEKVHEDEAKATMNDEGCPNPGDKTESNPRITRKGNEATPSK